MYNDNKQNFLDNLNYACGLCIDYKNKIQELSELEEEELRIENDLKKIEKIFNIKLNEIFSRNSHTNQKLKMALFERINKINKRVNKVYHCLILLAFIIILIVCIFPIAKDSVKKSYFPIKYDLVSSFDSIECILQIVVKIILFVLFFAVCVLLSYFVAKLVALVISKIIMFIYTHSFIYKKYEQRIQDIIDSNNHDTMKLHNDNLDFRDAEKKNKNEEKMSNHNKIKQLKSYINDLENKLNNSILSCEYVNYRDIVNIGDNGNYNLVGFAMLTQIYDLDPLLFAYNNFSGEDLNFKHVRKDFLLSDNEYRFYNRLVKVIQKDNTQISSYDVFSSVRLIDFFKIDKKDKNSFNKTKSKHIDFAVVNNSGSNMNVMLLIELDDNSHIGLDRMYRDFYINILLSNKGYKLLRTDNSDDLFEKISKAYHSKENILIDYSDEFERKYKEQLHEFVMNKTKYDKHSTKMLYV